MLLGQYSTGKTTFIKHLLRSSYREAHVGPEPTTDRFVVVMPLHALNPKSSEVSSKPRSSSIHIIRSRVATGSRVSGGTSSKLKINARQFNHQFVGSSAPCNSSWDGVKTLKICLPDIYQVKDWKTVELIDFKGEEEMTLADKGLAFPGFSEFAE
ncbi:hypothetical protein L1987_48178 [Smallanthus sonchifolius]|uniref:Uncharacterized protein n=1 Tax=Smallanthus sonchifolius TaxID=185202 RepID=A0ACB9FQL5_9ASTR|nr:hypothetical protein L1987_48178 [Smallanthus sonchifolius]